MKNCTIFVEGLTDKPFLEELLIRMKYAEKHEIKRTDGWAKLEPSMVEKAVDNDNGVVLIVFDADAPDKGEGGNRGGFENRLHAIQKRLDEYKPGLSGKIPIFLLPDNQSDGDLETLLEEMVRVEHRDIVKQCWTGYANCLTTKGYNQPTRKSKMHEYAAAIDSGVWDHGGFDKSFCNDEIWNWNANALDPLKKFLREKFKIT